MTSFRDVAYQLSPSRLRRYWAARFVYSLVGLPLDMVAQAGKEAARARFPSYCPDDALPYHGRDRGIPRGPNEGRDGYVQRLLQWRDIWSGSGVGRALLDEIAAYLTPSEARLMIVTQTGVVYTRWTDGQFGVEHVTPPNFWNWDGNTALWARFWLVIYSIGPNAPWSRDGTWNDGEHWGEHASTASWGSTATLEQIASIRSIILEHKPAQSVCQNIIISFDDDAFHTPPFPDGLWGHWSKNVGGVQVPARDSRGIYWDGVK